MPIAVTCPSCDSNFNVKDIYAGKRAKCPSCGEPMSIPAAPPARAASPVARPVVAGKPKPVVDDDESDEPVRPTRKRRDEEDEEPVSPKRKRGARSRDDADEKPKKKGSALPLILGVVGGVVVLGGGVTAAVLLSQPPTQATGSVTTPRVAPEDSGVVGIPPLSPKTLSTDELVVGIDQFRGQTVSVKGVAEFVGGEGKKGSIILRGGTMKTQIVCNFEDTGNNAPPEVGETVEVRGSVETVSNVAQVRLKNCQLLNGKPFVTLNVANLLKEVKKYEGKVVVVTGTVGEVVDLLNPPLLNLEGPGEDYLTCSPPPQGWAKLPKTGDTVTLRGRVRLVDRMDGSKGCSFEQCEVVEVKP